MRRPIRSLVTLLLVATAGPATAQTAPPARQVNVPEQRAAPADVATIDGLMRAFYAVISGPAGQPREWGRDRTLYVPDVRFVTTGVDRNGAVRARIVTHQQYVDLVDAGFVAKGFFETETARCVRRFGNVAQVLSAYESRERADGPVTDRGVNALQLYWDGTRWWVMSVAWDEERPGNAIPASICAAQ